MQEALLKYFIWFLFGVVGILITFYVFGVELPLYLLLAIGGLAMCVYSTNPAVKFAGGFVGRFFATLFIVSLLYYFGTRTFFPDNPLSFRFLKIGIQLTIEFFNNMSNFIGKFVLKLIDIIIP